MPTRNETLSIWHDTVKTDVSYRFLPHCTFKFSKLAFGFGVKKNETNKFKFKGIKTLTDFTNTIQNQLSDQQKQDICTKYTQYLSEAYWKTNFQRYNEVKNKKNWIKTWKKLMTSVQTHITGCIANNTLSYNANKKPSKANTKKSQKYEIPESDVIDINDLIHEKLLLIAPTDELTTDSLLTTIKAITDVNKQQSEKIKLSNDLLKISESENNEYKHENTDLKASLRKAQNELTLKSKTTRNVTAKLKRANNKNSYNSTRKKLQLDSESENSDSGNSDSDNNNVSNQLAYARSEKVLEIMKETGYCDRKTKLCVLKKLENEFPDLDDKRMRKWANRTNKEFDNYAKENALDQALLDLEHNVTTNQDSQKRLNITHEKKNDKSRRTKQYTSTGVRYGGGMATGYKKLDEKNKLEKEIIAENLHFVPINRDCSIDHDFKRFREEIEEKSNSIENDEDIDVVKIDYRKLMKGQKDYIGFVANDVKHKILDQLTKTIRNDAFTNATELHESHAMRNDYRVKVLSWTSKDGYSVGGNSKNSDRTIYLVQSDVWKDGIACSYSIKTRIMIMSVSESNVLNKKCQLEYVDKILFDEMNGTTDIIWTTYGTKIYVEWDWQVSADRKNLQFDLGNAGTSGLICQTETAIYTPSTRKIKYILLKEETYKTATLPYIDDTSTNEEKAELKENEQRLMPVEVISHWQRETKDILAELNEQFPVKKDDDKKKNPNLQLLHDKRVAYCRENKIGIMYKPNWKAYSFVKEIQHYFLTGATCIPKDMANYMNTWNISDEVIKIIIDSFHKNPKTACNFADQFENYYNGKANKLSWIGEIMTRVLRMIPDMLILIEKELKNDSQCLIWCNMFENVFLMKRKRRNAYHHTFTGINDPILLQLNTDTNWYYLSKLRIRKKDRKPYDHIWKYVLCPATKRFIKHSPWNHGPVVACGEGHEAYQKKDKKGATCNSNGDDNELAKQSNLSSHQYGIDFLIRKGKDYVDKLMIKNKKNNREFLTEEDIEKHKKLILQTADRTQTIYKLMIAQDWSKPLSAELKTIVNRPQKYRRKRTYAQMIDENPN